MNPSRSPEKGEVLQLWPPTSGEVVITVDPGSTGTAFAVGTQTLLPGAACPVQKHLDWDRVLFVHKGQARATLNERAIVVVPGSMLYVPRGAWHGLRNTGTGTLQVAWVSSPPGLEAFFRDLSRAGASPSTQALQELAQRHRVEFGQAAPTDVGAPPGRGRGRRGRRGGRRNRGAQGPARPDSPGSAVTPSSASPEPLSITPPVAPIVTTASPISSGAPTATGAPRGHRRRRGRGGGDRQPGGLRRSSPEKDRAGSAGRTPRVSAPPSPTSPSGSVGRPALAGRHSLGSVEGAASVVASQPSSRPPAGRQRPPRGRHRRRVREVYMGGRWIQVEGEGPVIAPGSDRSQRLSPKPDGDDEPPAVRLSVPL